MLVSDLHSLAGDQTTSGAHGGNRSTRSTERFNSFKNPARCGTDNVSEDISAGAACQFNPHHRANPSWHIDCAAQQGKWDYEQRQFLFILTTAAFVSAAQLTSAQERNGSYRIEGGASNKTSEPAQVEGRWYTNGERRKPARIISSRLGGTEARNELGQFTRIEFDGNGSIRALDWDDGVRGDIRRRGRIEWANGITWTRKPHQ